MSDWLQRTSRVFRTPPAASWAEFLGPLEEREDQPTLFTLLLDPLTRQEVLLGFRIQAFLSLGRDYAALSYVCRQRGFFTGLLRQERLHQEIAVFGYELAYHRRDLRAQRLGFLRSIWLIDSELNSHRPFGQ